MHEAEFFRSPNGRQSSSFPDIVIRLTQLKRESRHQTITNHPAVQSKLVQSPCVSDGRAHVDAVRAYQTGYFDTLVSLLRVALPSVRRQFDLSAGGAA